MFHKSSTSAQTTIRALGALTLAVALAAGCGPLDEAELEQLAGESDVRDPMAGTTGVGASAATFTQTASGAGWRQLSVSGTLKDEETGLYKTLSNDQVLVVTGSAGIASVPLPATIRSELSADLSASLASGAFKSADEAVYFVHKATAEQVAAGTLPKPVAESGVKTFALCGDYDKTLQKTVSFDKALTYNKAFNNSGFSGNLNLSGRVKGSATGKVLARIKRSLCVPYWAKLKTIQVSGSLNANARVTSSGSFSKQWSWKSQILKHHIGSFTTMVGPLPIHIGFNMPVDLGLDAAAQVQAKLDGSVTANGTFNVTCNTSTCSGTKTFNYGYTENSAPTASLNGKVKVKPWIQGAVRAYLFSDSVAYGQVGVKPYLEGELWGYAGNSCGDADNDGTNETVSALTLDADVGIDVTAKVYVISLVNKDWNWPVGRWHVGFWDLLPGGSSAAVPIFYRKSTYDEVLLPGTTPSAGATFKGRMRPCWPYTASMQYAIDWREGTPQSVTYSPSYLFSKSHTWSGAMPDTVTLKAVKDSHGRTLNKTRVASTTATSPLIPKLPGSFIP